MALIEVIPSSYAVIENIFAEYNARAIRFTLNVYRDKSKKELILKGEYYFHELDKHDYCSMLGSKDDETLFLYCDKRKLVIDAQTKEPKPDAIPYGQFLKVFPKGNIIKGCYEILKARGLFPNAQDS